MDVIKTRPDGKLVEMFDTEAADFDAGRVRMHRQPPCRFNGCHQEWYLSDRKQAFHDRRMKEDSGWRMPTSCPEHRHLSILSSIMSNNQEKCSTGKQRFNTSEAALAFTAVMAKTNNSPQQRCYLCDACHGYHLSSLTLEQNDEIQRNKNGSSGVIPPQNAQSIEERICAMYEKSTSISQIAKALGVDYQRVRGILIKTGVHSVTKQSIKREPVTPRPLPADPEDLQTAIEQAAQKLEALRRKQALMEEARKLRVEVISPAAFRIAKEGEQAILPMTELEPLITQLMTLYQEYSKEKPTR